jgi:murein DD-endopeptidase MepM/ murein hydrolase activator NlpD
MTRPPVVAALVLGALLAGIAGAAPSTPPTGALAVVVRVTTPQGSGASAGEVFAPPTASEELPGFAYPADGSVVRIGLATTSATSLAGTSASAQAIVDGYAVSLFGGEVVVESLSVAATAAAGTANVTADVSRSAVQGLVVLGQPVPAASDLQVPLADWGRLDVLTTRTESGTGDDRWARGAVTALRLRLLADHGGMPAETEIVVAAVESTAAAASSGPEATPGPAVTPDAKPSRPSPAPSGPAPAPPARPAGPREPGRTIPGAPADVVQPIPEGLASPRLSAGGYVFPVYGPASFADTFGAPRADVVGGWHHGEDIFAATGAPLLAVADGTVFSVGWNDIGGWRLWLRDEAGNEFYYAHLSAYSPLAVDGRRVRAGDVLGFVGKTGDAEYSPPHLHFEIHPAEMLALGYDGVVAPYPYLVAWRRAQDISFAAGRIYLSADGGSVPGRASAPPVGAVLLEARDISSASGLVPGAIERALDGTTQAAQSGYAPANP